VAKDRTVSLDGRVYEAPTRLIGEYIQLRYHEDRTDQVEIWHKNASQGFLVPLNPHVNCHVKRRKNQDCLVPRQDTTGISGQLNFTSEAD